MQRIRANIDGRWLRRISFAVGLTMSAGLNGALLAPPVQAKTVQPAGGPFWPSPKASDQVTTLQYLLRGRGFRVVVDGRFGAQTRRQIRNFQRSRGLKADGVVGPQTWKALIVPLKKGSRGDAVRGLQTLLYPYAGLTVDGTFGAKTARGLRDFQEKYGLPVDGVAGPVTWRWLLANAYDDWCD